MPMEEGGRWDLEDTGLTQKGQEGLGLPAGNCLLPGWENNLLPLSGQGRQAAGRLDRRQIFPSSHPHRQPHLSDREGKLSGVGQQPLHSLLCLSQPCLESEPSPACLPPVHCTCLPAPTHCTPTYLPLCLLPAACPLPAATFKHNIACFPCLLLHAAANIIETVAAFVALETGGRQDQGQGDGKKGTCPLLLSTFSTLTCTSHLPYTHHRNTFTLHPRPLHCLSH